MMTIYAYGFCMLMTGGCQIEMIQNAGWGPDPRAYCERMAEVQNRNNGDARREIDYRCFKKEVPTWE